MTPQVRRYGNLEDLNRAAAQYICDAARECVNAKGIFSLVLSGGKTPETLYACLAQPPFDVKFPWEQTHVFWGDERCASPDREESNYGMAQKAFISKVPLPPENIYRIPGEMKPPERAAVAYEQTLRRFFQAHQEADAFPSFDLILLGVGADGHIASLFPNHDVLRERKRWVAYVRSPNAIPPVPRITLTFPILNNAAHILFLVAGEAKRQVFQSILGDTQTIRKDYPAAMLKPRGEVIWFNSQTDC